MQTLLLQAACRKTVYMVDNSVHCDASFMNAKIFLLHHISLQNYGTVPHTHDGGSEGATEPGMVKDNWDKLK